MAAPTVGLTGGIASGKSTVARMFADLGVPAIDADDVAREVALPGTPGLAAIVQTFGAGVLAPDGTLDRKALGEQVFGDAAARRTLESILHPRIAVRSAERIAAAAASGAPYVLYDAALIVERGLHRAMAALVVVAVDEATQLARLRARDGIDEDAARTRLDAQLPLAEKVAVATHVVDNTGSLDSTRARVRDVHADLVRRFGAEGR